VVERKLGEKWRQLMQVRKLVRPSGHREEHGHEVLRRLLALINRMHVFVQRYLHFVTVEVIDPHWHDMMMKMGEASSIDEVRHSPHPQALEYLHTNTLASLVMCICASACHRMPACSKVAMLADVHHSHWLCCTFR
jgi:hypothetical protein